MKFLGEEGKKVLLQGAVAIGCPWDLLVTFGVYLIVIEGDITLSYSEFKGGGQMASQE